jgi:hypothetical protein
VGGRVDFYILLLMQFRDGSDSECASKFVLISENTEEESISRIRRVQTHRDRKGETGEDSKLNNFFDIKGLLKNNSSWQAKQSMAHSTVTFYGNWLFHHDNAPSQTSFMTRKFLTKNSTTTVRHPPYFSVLRIEDKTERPSY